MTDTLRQFLPLLNCLPQPAIWLFDGRVRWRSASAERLGVQEGDLFPALPSDKEEQTRMSLTLAGEEWDAMLEPAEGGVLVFLIRGEAGDVGALRAMARGLQPIVTSAVAAGSELFPRIEELEDEQMQSAAAQLSRDCYRLIRAVGSLEQYGRLQEEPENAQMRQIDVLEFLRKLTDQARDVLLDANVRLDVSIPQGSILACVEERALSRAVLNLLSNAAKYCGEDRVVSLLAERQDQILLIRVSDHGQGFPPDVLANVFSQYREGGATRDARRGAGLGLALVKAVAQQHGGNVLIVNHDGACVTMSISLVLPQTLFVRTPETTFADSYDPALLEFSCLLPPGTFDSRSVDL